MYPHARLPNATPGVRQARIARKLVQQRLSRSALREVYCVQPQSSHGGSDVPLLKRGRKFSEA